MFRWVRPANESCPDLHLCLHLCLGVSNLVKPLKQGVSVYHSVFLDLSQEEFEKLVRQAFDDVLSVDLAMPLSPGESGRGKKQKNRGFAFVHFTSHAAAARAFRIGSKPDFRLGDDWHPIVDWAEKEAELDPEEMARITVAFVANLPGDVTEDYLRRLFEPFGKLERVAISRKSNAPVGFVHYTSRSELDKAIKELDGKLVQGPGKGPKFNLQVSVARTIVKADKRTHDESQAKSTRGASQYKSSNTYDHSDDRKMKVPRIDSPVENTGVADPYEAAVLSLPSSITGRLLRIFRLGIATRYDIDIQCITSLKELPESTAVAVLDEHQAGRLGITHDSFAVRRRSTEFTSIEPDFAKERASVHTPTYDSYISRPAATSSIRYGYVGSPMYHCDLVSEQIQSMVKKQRYPLELSMENTVEVKLVTKVEPRNTHTVSNRMEEAEGTLVVESMSQRDSQEAAHIKLGTGFTSEGKSHKVNGLKTEMLLHILPLPRQPCMQQFLRNSIKPLICNRKSREVAKGSLSLPYRGSYPLGSKGHALCKEDGA
ncbi:putative RNA-binding protein 46 [Nymphaea thermarum]|nr:putative RNA-binding protein 46 [Nymphaea thermarum]